MLSPGLCLVDHRRQPRDLLPQAVDLAIHLGHRGQQELTPLGRVLRGPEAGTDARARRLVLEQLPDLREREPGVVAEALDEAETPEVLRVVEAIGALRPRRQARAGPPPRSSGSPGSSGRSRQRPPGCAGDGSGGLVVWSGSALGTRCILPNITVHVKVSHGSDAIEACGRGMVVACTADAGGASKGGRGHDAARNRADWETVRSPRSTSDSFRWR